MANIELAAPLDLVTLQSGGLPPIPWIVEPYLAQGDMCVIVGDGGSGKTFLALDLALGLAANQTVLGRQQPTAPRRVLYLDQDSSVAQISRRLIGIAHGRGLTFQAMGEAFAAYSDVGFRLDSDAGRSLIEQALNRHRPQVVFLDALRAFHGLEESDTASMSILLRHVLRPLCSRHGMSVVLIHHTNKEAEIVAIKRKAERDAARAIRGATEIRNAVDITLYVERRRGVPTLYMDKTRWIEDSDKPDPMPFKPRELDEGRIVVECSAWLAQPKALCASNEIIKVLETDGPLTAGPLMRKLEGLEMGAFGRRTAWRTLAALITDRVIAQQEDGAYELASRVK